MAMQLKLKDIVNLFKVSESTVYRWIKEEQLPAYRHSNQYHFNRSEILEWATTKGIQVPSELIESSNGRVENLPELSEALREGGIKYNLPGKTKYEILRNIISELKLPQNVDRNLIFQLLWARESLETTAIGDGIAIPHPRSPIVLRVKSPIVKLCFTEQPVDFGAPDGKPVFALFTLISPTVKIHQHLLARLSSVLRDPEFRATLERKGSEQEIIERIKLIESTLKAKNQVHKKGDQQ